MEAFPGETAPSSLLRDRDTIYGRSFRQRVKSMGILDVVAAAHSHGRTPPRNGSSEQAGARVWTMPGLYVNVSDLIVL